jgi:hypothetical protein
MAWPTITIKLWSAFAVGAKNDPRWDHGPVKGNVVRHATIEIVGERRTASTDVNGEATLDVTGLRDGPFVLRLQPAPNELSPGPAGPANGKPRVPAPGEPPVPPEREYRPLEVWIWLRNGKINKTDAPLVNPAMSHGRVLKFEDYLLSVDWKPDWVRAYTRPRPKDTKVTAIVLHHTSAPEGQKVAVIGSTLNMDFALDGAYDQGGQA